MNFSILRSWWTLVALVLSLVLAAASYNQWLDKSCRQPAIRQMAIENGTDAYVVDRDGNLNVVSVFGLTGAGGEARNVPLPAPACDLAVSGKKLFLAAGDAGLYAVDASDIRNPRLEGHLPVNAMAIDIAGSNAYLVNGNGSLDIVDVANPAQMSVLASVPAPAVRIDAGGGRACPVAIVDSTTGERAHWVARIHVSGERAYLAAGEAGLIVVDVKKVSSPAIVATVPTTGSAEDVAADENFAYVANGTEGLLVVRLSESGEPREEATLPLNGETQRVLKDNKFVYLTTANSGLHVVHVLNPSAPKEVKSGLPAVPAVVDMAESLGMLVLATQSGSLLIANVSNPCDPLNDPDAIGDLDRVAAVAMLPPYFLPVTSAFPNFRIWASLVFPLVILLRLAAYRRRARKALGELTRWRDEAALWIAVALLVLALGYQLWRQTV